LTERSLNPTRFSAALRIFGSGLDLASISNSVSLSPSHQHKKGDPDRLSDPYPNDLWSLSSPLPRADTLATHLLWLRNTFAPHYRFLEQLKQTAEVRSFCGVIADGTSCAFRVPAGALRLFTELDVEMEVSLIFLGYYSPAEDEDKFGSSLVTTEETGAEPELGSCRKDSQVSLELCGHELDLTNTSRLLEVEPSEFHLASQLDSSGKPYLTNRWSLHISMNPEAELSDHIASLGNLLSRHAESIMALKRKNEVVIRCRFGTESDHGGFDVSTAALQLPVALDLAFQFETRLL
jgi:hypothetical protein